MNKQMKTLDGVYFNDVTARQQIAGKADRVHTHSFNQLTNKPQIPEQYDDTQLRQQIAGKANSAHTHSYNDLTDKPQTSESYDDTQIRQQIAGKANAVHTHSYNDLTDKPTIPEGYDDALVKSDIVSLNTALTTLGNSKQDKLTAGENISIVDNVISATGASEPTMELIESVTISEKSSFTRIAQPDGTPYYFESMLVYITNPDVGQDAWKVISLSSASDGSGGYAKRIYGSYMQNNQKFLALVAYKAGGMWHGSNYYYTSENYSAYTPYHFDCPVTNDNDKIRRLYIASVVANTTITIYAVRA